MSRHQDDEDERYYVIEEKRGGGIGSFLLGAAIGAGIALLLAPQSGEETRRDLKLRARKVTDAARDAADDLTDTVVDRYAKAKRSVGDTIDSARQAIDLKKHQATEAIRAGREAAAQAREELEARLAETKAAYQPGGDLARPPRQAANMPPLAKDVETGDPHAS